MAQPAKDGRTLHSPQCNRTLSRACHACPSSRRGWIKRVMITQSRAQGHIPRLGCFVFADLAPRAGSRTTFFVHFPAANARNRRRAGVAPTYTGPLSCPLAGTAAVQTDAAIDPFTGLAGPKEKAAGGCRPVAQPLAKDGQEPRVTSWTGKEHSPVTPTRKCGMGVRGRLVWANPSVGF